MMKHASITLVILLLKIREVATAFGHAVNQMREMLLGVRKDLMSSLNIQAKMPKSTSMIVI
jgi:hypothetical protein